MYTRLCNPLLSNSFFLFGGRGTGKSTLLKSLFSNQKAYWVDLLKEDDFRQYLLNPELLRQRIPSTHKKGDWIIIDEVQRVPALLNEVHRLIEELGFRFALTGSSARKLKRGGANLLAGRAFTNHLHPLTSRELGDEFELDLVLRWGTLPAVCGMETDLERAEFLRSYVSTYLKEEIKEEQLVRKVEPFLRFLEIAAQCSGTIINASKIARDAGTSPKAVDRYFEILEDTLIGFRLPPFHRSVRKRQLQRSKFYLFDAGVKHALDRTLQVPVNPRTSAFGHAFEQFFIQECIRLNDYLRKDYRFSYFRTKDDLEIDLVVERPGKKLLLIEIKSSTQVDDTEIERLRKIKSDLEPCDLWVVSREDSARRSDFYTIHPWNEALDTLFSLTASSFPRSNIARLRGSPQD